jgi:hypothetical protein
MPLRKVLEHLQRVDATRFLEGAIESVDDGASIVLVSVEFVWLLVTYFVGIPIVEVQSRKRQKSSVFDFAGTYRQPTKLKPHDRIVERVSTCDVKSEYVRPTRLSHVESHPAIGPFVPWQ